MSHCSERLSEEAVCSTGEGNRTAQQGEVAWVAALNIATHLQTHTEPFPVIDHSERASEQQKDPVIGKIVEQKEKNTDMTEERHRTLDNLIRNVER